VLPKGQGPQGNVLEPHLVRRPIPTLEKLRRTRSLVILIVALALYQHTSSDWLNLLMMVAGLQLTLWGYLIGPKFGYYSHVVMACMLNPIMVRTVVMFVNEVPPISMPAMIKYTFAFAVHLGLARLLGFGGPYPLQFITVRVPRSL
jgi:hypothetical protein